MLKVLWFSNNPAAGMEFLSRNSKIKSTGGWLSALNYCLRDKLELYIAFHYPYKISDFHYNNTHYLPIFTGNIYINLLKKRISNSVVCDKYLEKYVSIINKYKPDIIHIHGTENLFLSIQDHVKIPVIVSIQGNITVYNHKFFSGFHGKYLNVKKYSSFKDFIIGTQSFGVNKDFFSKMALIEEKAMRSIKYIVGRTDWDYRITRVLSPNSVYYKAEELLRNSFYLNEWDNCYKNGKIVLFTTNSNNYYKGLETVFQCIDILDKAGINFEWRIAGVNDNSLITLISKKFLSKKFPTKGYLLLGSLDENQLVNELLNSHIYVMPSHIENSANSLCEAMILGMPCIATFAGGTGSILKDGEDGILIQDGDPWVMSGSIIELMNQPLKAILYGKNARKRALVRHNKEIVTKQYLNIYKELTNKK